MFVKFEINKIPENCSECPFYSTSNYICHNERGIESHCAIGYMNHSDMRDFDGRHKRFNGCKIEEDIYA